MMPARLTSLTPSELLQPIWKEIDSLNAREHYKEAYQYLRFVTTELTILHEAIIDTSSILATRPDTSSSFHQLMMQIEAQLKPVKDESVIRYMVSLRVVLQTIHKMLCQIGCFDLEMFITELCLDQCNQLSCEDLSQIETHLPSPPLH